MKNSETLWIFTDKNDEMWAYGEVSALCRDQNLSVRSIRRSLRMKGWPLNVDSGFINQAVVVKKSKKRGNKRMGASYVMD